MPRDHWELAYRERGCTKHRPGLVGERMGTLPETVDQLRLDAVRAEPWRAQGAHEGLASRAAGRC